MNSVCSECGGTENPALWGHKSECSFWDAVRPPRPSLEMRAAKWVDDRGDDESIGHYREPVVRERLIELLTLVRTEALSTDARNAEAMENEACALMIDSLLGDGCKPAQFIRQRIKDRNHD